MAERFGDIDNRFSVPIDTIRLNFCKKKAETKIYADTISIKSSPLYKLLMSQPRFNSYDLNSFGWLNVDYFLKNKNALETNLELVVNSEVDVLFCYVLLAESKTIISKKFKGSGTHIFFNKEMLPAGEAHLLVVGLKGESLSFTKQKFKIGLNSIDLELTPISQEHFIKEVDSLEAIYE